MTIYVNKYESNIKLPSYWAASNSSAKVAIPVTFTPPLLTISPVVVFIVTPVPTLIAPSVVISLSEVTFILPANVDNPATL